MSPVGIPLVSGIKLAENESKNSQREKGYET